jgi:triosephosphate isomerase
MRRSFVCGNWKMYKTPSEARVLARDIARGLRGDDGRVEVAVCPPFPAIAAVAESLRESPVAWGGQNCAPQLEGAYTGETSAAMLVDLGGTYAILGHSERRQFFAETDSTVHEKLEAVLGCGLTPILCVGETLEEREADRTSEVVGRQLRGALAGLPGPEIARSVIAYEPVWAIGTGRTATPDMAEAMHREIRELLATMIGEDGAEAVRILYGGSVKPGNAADLFSRPNIDGGLIGGASLTAPDFLAIVRAGCSTE